jgi:hypothetical protein
MIAKESIQRRYMVSTRPADRADLYRVSYLPRGPQQVRLPGKANRVPEFIATVRTSDEHVKWETEPQPNGAAEQLSDDALRRTKAVHAWLTMLTDLIGSVEQWAKDLGWSTKRIEKPMEDSDIGRYVAPALLLQEQTTKVLLEPITRSAPGADGVVDLYLMPGYDDIASLYFYDNRWHLHYLSPEQKGVPNIREAESKPFTKAVFKKVLEEMTANAQ